MVRHFRGEIEGRIEAVNRRGEGAGIAAE